MMRRLLIASLLALLPTVAQAQVISHVQTITGGQVLSTSGTGSGATNGSFGSNLTAGNSVVVAVGGWHASDFTVSTVTDGLGNSYSRIAQRSATSGDSNCSIWLATGVNSGAATITVTPTQGSSNFYAWSATELTVSGGGNTDEDTVAEVSNQGDASSTDGNTGTGSSTTVADAWTIACLVVATGDSSQNITTATTGYTRRGVSQDSANVIGFEMADKQLSATAAQSATWTHDNSTGEWAAVLTVIKKVSGGGGGGTVNYLSLRGVGP